MERKFWSLNSLGHNDFWSCQVGLGYLTSTIKWTENKYVHNEQGQLSRFSFGFKPIE